MGNNILDNSHWSGKFDQTFGSGTFEVMPDDKKTFKVRCPLCKELNILQVEDFRGLAIVTFICAKSGCGKEITLSNPELETQGSL